MSDAVIVKPEEMAQCAEVAAQIRHVIHRYPEIGLNLTQTEKTIVEALKSFGCEDITTRVGGPDVAGVVCVIKGDATGLQTAGFSNHIGNDGILVSNSIRLRANVPGYGIGLGNLCQQYAIYGKSMEILRRHDEFAVRLPYIE